MTTSNVLMGMVFKIKFLRTMLVEMSREDLNLFSQIAYKIGTGEANEKDFRDLDYLAAKWEQKSLPSLRKYED